jgi:hypothetical protein
VFAESAMRLATAERWMVYGPSLPTQVKVVSPAPGPLISEKATPSSLHRLHVPAMGSGPDDFEKQTSFAQEFPVYENTDWLVVHDHFAPTPAVVPAGKLELNPPGPADRQTKVNALPPVRLVTVFSIVTGNV